MPQDQNQYRNSSCKVCTSDSLTRYEKCYSKETVLRGKEDVLSPVCSLSFKFNLSLSFDLVCMSE